MRTQGQGQGIENVEQRGSTDLFEVPLQISSNLYLAVEYDSLPASND